MKKITISMSVIVLLAILFSFENLHFIGALISSIAIHEVGHCCAIAVLGGAVKRCRLSVSGMNIEYTGKFFYGGECFVAVSGAAANIVAFCVAVPFAQVYKSDVLIFFCAVNILLCIFNMLPALPLDGGVFLRAALLKIIPLDMAEKIVLISTLAVGSLLMIFGIVTICAFGGNITPIVASIVILNGAVRKMSK